MPELKDWKVFVDKCNGTMIAWINQTAALKGTDSAGVCNAVTLDYMLSLDTIPNRAAFYNKFKNPDPEKDFPEFTLPKNYIDQQKQLQQQYVLNLDTLEKKLEAIREYAKTNPNNKIEIDKMYTEYFLLEPTIRGGDKCLEVTAYDSLDELIKFFKILGQISCAFTLHMFSGASGHALAFNFVHIPGTGPEDFVYNILDPNTGWFYFKTFREIYIFFTVPVMGNYKNKYTTFKVNEYRKP